MILRKLMMGRPINVLILINGLFFSLLYFYGETRDPMIPLAGALLTALMVLCYYIIIKGRMGDQYVFLIISILCSLGVVMLYRLDPHSGMKQVIWYGIGAMMYFAAYFIFRWVKGWDRYIFLYLAGSLVLFAMTFILGSTVKGATNWVKIGPLSFQPAEIIKLCYVFFIAAYFKNRETLKHELIFLALVYLHIGLLFLQRELGMAMLFYGVFISIYYIYYQERRFFYYNLGASLLLALVAYFTMGHVRVRFEAWLNPWADISGKGYQIAQSLFAIAEGGFFGKGLGLGNPTFIPEVHTDFIFSAICEELGIFGGMAVVLLYFILIYRGFKITFTIQETFKRIVALGITLTYGYQTFIIIGGVIKLIPLTGITLPFISYGGSSLVSAFISFGILQGLSKKLPEGEELVSLGEQ